MKFQQKKRIVQKLWGWISLAINCLIMTIFLAEKVTNFLSGGILFSASIICYGVVKTKADKTKNDLSGISVVIEYICIYMITLLSAFKLSGYLSSNSLLIALTISSMTELLILLIITYWNTIRRMFF